MQLQIQMDTEAALHAEMTKAARLLLMDPGPPFDAKKLSRILSQSLPRFIFAEGHSAGDEIESRIAIVNSLSSENQGLLMKYDREYQILGAYWRGNFDLYVSMVTGRATGLDLCTYPVAGGEESMFGGVFANSLSIACALPTHPDEAPHIGCTVLADFASLSDLAMAAILRIIINIAPSGNMFGEPVSVSISRRDEIRRSALCDFVEEVRLAKESIASRYGDFTSSIERALAILRIVSVEQSARLRRHLRERVNERWRLKCEKEAAKEAEREDQKRFEEEGLHRLMMVTEALMRQTCKDQLGFLDPSRAAGWPSSSDEHDCLLVLADPDKVMYESEFDAVCGRSTWFDTEVQTIYPKFERTCLDDPHNCDDLKRAVRGTRWALVAFLHHVALHSSFESFHTLMHELARRPGLTRGLHVSKKHLERLKRMESGAIHRVLLVEFPEWNGGSDGPSMKKLLSAVLAALP